KREEGAEGKGAIAPDDEADDAVERAEEAGDEKREKRAFPTRKRSEKPHELHIAEAHRGLAEDERAHDADEPHEPAADEHPGERCDERVKARREDPWNLDRDGEERAGDKRREAGGEGE